MTRTKVIDYIEKIATDYHVAEMKQELPGKVFPVNLAFLSLSYILDKNHLLLGDPGWGKTTSAQLVSSVFSGIPFDLYESMTIEGHPGLFTEKWKARLHYGDLNDGKETVIWQGAFGLDTLIVDEANRLTADVQDEILEGIRTGRWKYMNSVQFEGKKPTFLTANDRDDGNGNMIPPLQDRIDIVTEESVSSPLSDYHGAQAEVERDLIDRDATNRAIAALAEMDYDGFKRAINNGRREDRLTGDEKANLKKEIEGMRVDKEALYFLWSFVSELNYSQQYGSKRASDPVSDDTHDKNHIGTCVNGSFSPRPQMAILQYAKGIAWLVGDEEVMPEHIKYVIPYASAHKLDFTEDFSTKHGSEIREDCETIHLARKLVEKATENYSKVVKPLRNVVKAVQNGTFDPKKQPKGVEYDHPFIRHLVEKKAKTQKMNLE